VRLIREESDDPRYERRAADAVARGVEVEQNEHGCYRSVHLCETCGDRFTVTPPAGPNFGPNCMAETCPSYDPARDASIFFAPDDPDLIETDP
jgi:hypothetical protein